MDNSDKMKNIYQMGGWERLVIFGGVILTVPLAALFFTAVYSLLVDRPAAESGIMISIICILALWAVVWIMLWIVAGFREHGRPPLTSQGTIEELLQENARLKALLAKSAEDKQGHHSPE